jgi:hypothetical protein
MSSITVSASASLNASSMGSQVRCRMCVAHATATHVPLAKRTANGRISMVPQRAAGHFSAQASAELMQRVPRDGGSDLSRWLLSGCGGRGGWH